MAKGNSAFHSFPISICSYGVAKGVGSRLQRSLPKRQGTFLAFLGIDEVFFKFVFQFFNGLASVYRSNLLLHFEGIKMPLHKVKLF